MPTSTSNFPVEAQGINMTPKIFAFKYEAQLLKNSM